MNCEEFSERTVGILAEHTKRIMHIFAYKQNFVVHAHGNGCPLACPVGYLARTKMAHNYSSWVGVDIRTSPKLVHSCKENIISWLLA